MFFMTFPAWTMVSTASLQSPLDAWNRFGLVLAIKFAGPESVGYHEQLNGPHRHTAPAMAFWDCRLWPRNQLGNNVHRTT